MTRTKKEDPERDAAAKRYGALYKALLGAVGASYHKQALALGTTASVIAGRATGRGLPNRFERWLACAMLEEFEGRPEELERVLRAGLERMKKEEGGA